MQLYLFIFIVIAPTGKGMIELGTVQMGSRERILPWATCNQDDREIDVLKPFENLARTTGMLSTF